MPNNELGIEYNVDANGIFLKKKAKIWEIGLLLGIMKLN